jgi:hypothetical protein
MTDKKENPGKSKASKDESEMGDLATALTSTESSLDTVRDILFGAQLRQTDQQRSDLEKSL